MKTIAIRCLECECFTGWIEINGLKGRRRRTTRSEGEWMDGSDCQMINIDEDLDEVECFFFVGHVKSMASENTRIDECTLCRITICIDLARWKTRSSSISTCGLPISFPPSSVRSLSLSYFSLPRTSYAPCTLEIDDYHMRNHTFAFSISCTQFLFFILFSFSLSPSLFLEQMINVTIEKSILIS